MGEIQLMGKSRAETQSRREDLVVVSKPLASLRLGARNFLYD